MTVQETLNLALQHHQAGKLAEAEGMYRRIGADAPEYADALHGLGVLARQRGRGREAVELIRQAIALKPDTTRFYLNLGTVFAEMGALDEAIAAYGKALALKPNYAAALSNLGDVLRRKGRIKEAIDTCRRATVIQPTLVEAHHNLGMALGASGELKAAIAALAKAAELRPDSPQFHNDWGAALLEDRALDAAATALQRAIALDPGLAEAHLNLSAVLLEKQSFEQAIAACRRALALRPDYVEAMGNLGAALLGAKKLEEAIVVLRKAVALRADFFQALTSLAGAYFETGQYSQAITLYERSRAIQPDYPATNFSLGVTRLLLGDFERGWPLYHWRWRLAEFAARTNPNVPLWDGGDLSGRKILIHGEQGFGDAIQFVRYLPMVAARGGKIAVACHGELHGLFQSGGVEVERWIAPSEPLGAFDVHTPLMSLPMILGTTQATIPASVPYLRADAAKAAYWRERLAGEPRLKIGVVWAGRSTNPNDRNRSIRLEQLKALSEVGGVSLYSLQKNDGIGHDHELTDWTDELHDFADTAALIENLDLVICVDTAVAHLAGALGKDVWVLVPFVPDWRWMLEREDSPWYPTMRLFRQTRRGDWATAIGKAVEAVRKRVGR